MAGQAHFETYPQQTVLADQLPANYGWRLQDANGEIIATGEGYTRRQDAERGARNVMSTVLEIAASDEPIDIVQADE